MEEQINKKQRMEFVEYWANYVRNNKNWSSQQAKLINSMLKNKILTKEQYLSMKKNN
ncbi:hypothetical protein HYV79_03200 [Candidatus Woesearchaeota archaeon]|nr:hypothetical protein [Candidatus Woesearchaeota archaeon]